ncbi:hypothetical protein LIPSTDRAFT_76687 [Lipomyces starkeyi NRRL Y-11557]|uniref:Uncharacterized protein n=1 Tax=Lipomyces starkeyi NRRL Y-11557 TaxID=675824 RepID=A0A1E3PTW0_LIPST|nr:hypothetical protein LIPSTDRAFT_76687 [Lipomyces starkeyi NRRL Y-11557]
MGTRNPECAFFSSKRCTDFQDHLFYGNSSALIKLGLKPILDEPCIFLNNWLIVFFFVYDIVLLYRPSDEAKGIEFQQTLMKLYAMRSLGDLKCF